MNACIATVLNAGLRLDNNELWAEAGSFSFLFLHLHLRQRFQVFRFETVFSFLRWCLMWI